MNPRRAALLLALAALAGCGEPGSAPPASPPANPAGPAPVSLTLPDGFTVFAPVAADPPSRERGLMGVSQVPPGQGMYFVFPEPIAIRFWMKNCLTPMDMIFMDEAGRVLHVEDSAPICVSDPCPTFGPPGAAPVQFVLELGPGEAARHGVRPGVTLPPPDRAALVALAR